MTTTPPSPQKRSKKLPIFLLILAFGLFVGAGVWWWYMNTQPSSGRLFMNEMFDPAPTIDPHLGTIITARQIEIPRGDWFDTGLFAGPWNMVSLIDTKQPIELKIGKDVFHSHLTDKGNFLIVAITAPLDFNSSDKVSIVSDHEKIFVRMPTSSPTSFVNPSFLLIKLSPEKIEEANKAIREDEEYRRHKENILVAIMGPLLGLWAIAIVYLIVKSRSEKTKP